MIALEPVVGLVAVFLLAAAPSSAQQSQVPGELDQSLHGALFEAIHRVAPGAGGVLDAPNPAQEMVSSFTREGSESMERTKRAAPGA